MTSEAVHHAANIIPYRMVLPENFSCPDPESRADGMLQARPITESDYILSNHFSHRSDMIVDTGGFVFYQPDDFNVRVRPDVYVAFGVDEGAIRRRNGYVVWEAGKPPDLALEVASETTHAVDTRTKPLIYSSMGITEYWRFDPTGGEWYGYALAGDILVNGVYQPIPLTTGPDGTVWGYSPVLDLDLCALSPEWRGRLRFYDPRNSRYLRNFDEEQAAHRETQAALAERDEALREEHVARLESEAELERLRAEARRLRGK